MNLNLGALASNQLLTLGSFFLAILGIALAIFFYLKSKKEKIPCFQLENRTLIEGIDRTLDGLQIHYKGLPQGRITVTKVLFWNAGRETIDKSDLVSGDQIRIECGRDVEVLDSKVTQVSEFSNIVTLLEPSVKEDSKVFPISFEYLDFEDYFIVQLVHSSTASANFEVAGKIKGVKILRHVIGKGKGVKSPFAQLVPFLSTLDSFVERPVFFKYVGSTIYAALGVFGVSEIIVGNTAWYMWLAVAFGSLGATVMFFGHRYLPPIKI